MTSEEAVSSEFDKMDVSAINGAFSNGHMRKEHHEVAEMRNGGSSSNEFRV